MPFLIDNFVQSEVVTAAFPFPWKQLRLKRLLPANLYKTDPVTYNDTVWLIHDFHDEGNVVILRPMEVPKQILPR